MERANHLRLTEQLRREVAGERPAHGAFAIDAERYRSAAWFERERALFAAPRIVATSAAVAERGACVPVDIPGASASTSAVPGASGTSAILARAPDGVLRAFANACRHRATRLIDAPCQPRRSSARITAGRMTSRAR